MAERHIVPIGKDIFIKKIRYPLQGYKEQMLIGIMRVYSPSPGVVEIEWDDNVEIEEKSLDKIQPGAVCTTEHLGEVTVVGFADITDCPDVPTTFPVVDKSGDLYFPKEKDLTRIS